MKLCKTCQQEINGNATKCNFCQSYQNWRRYTGEINVISVIALASTITAIVIGISQLSGVSESVAKLQNENTLLTESNVKKNSALRDVSFVLQNMEEKAEVSDKKTKQLEKVVELQQGYIGSINNNIAELTSLIENN